MLIGYRSLKGCKTAETVQEMGHYECKTPSPYSENNYKHTLLLSFPNMFTISPMSKVKSRRDDRALQGKIPQMAPLFPPYLQ